MQQPERRRFLQSAAASAAAAGAAAAGAAALPGLGQAAEHVKPMSQKMPTRPLGKTGVRVPVLHLGTSQRLDQKYDKVLHRCFREGINWFDTALSYGWGSSHRAIANFITQIGDRSRLMLTSKSGSGHPSGLRQDIDEALNQLGTNYLDLYLMHGIDDLEMLGRDYLAAGEHLKRQGKTRFLRLLLPRWKCG